MISVIENGLLFVMTPYRLRISERNCCGACLHSYLLMLKLREGRTVSFPTVQNVSFSLEGNVLAAVEIFISTNKSLNLNACRNILTAWSEQLET